MDVNIEQESISNDTGIVLEDLDGKSINLEDYRGQVVFLNFWATWCKPCISEMPAIDRLIDMLDEDEFIFLAASDESLEKIQKFATKYPHEFKYVKLRTNIYQLGLSVLPTTFIINKDGEIIERIIGAREWDSEEMVSKLREI